MSSEDGAHQGWRFVTNHTQVLLCIAGESDVRLRDVAETVGITERAAQRIVEPMRTVDASARTSKAVGIPWSLFMDGSAAPR